jgi:hypothetical protein
MKEISAEGGTVAAATVAEWLQGFPRLDKPAVPPPQG